MKKIISVLLTLIVFFALSSSAVAENWWDAEGLLSHPDEHDGTVDWVPWRLTNQYQREPDQFFWVVVDQSVLSGWLPDQTAFYYGVLQPDGTWSNYELFVHVTWKVTDSSYGVWLERPFFGPGVTSGMVGITVHAAFDYWQPRTIYQDWEYFKVDGKNPNPPSNPAAGEHIWGREGTASQWTWYNWPYIKFSWNAAEDPIENHVASGIGGYWTYFGKKQWDQITDSDWQWLPADQLYKECNIAGDAFQNGIYNFFIKSIDKVGNQSNIQWMYTYYYDKTSPTVQLNNFEATITKVPDFLVSWSGNDGPNPGIDNAGVGFYTVQYKREEDATWTDWLVDTGATSWNFDRPLEDGKKYFFRVKAKDWAGNESDWSLVKEITTDFTVPSSVIKPFASPTTTDTSLKVEWQPSLGSTDIASYDISYKVSDGFGEGNWTLWLNDTTKTSEYFNISQFNGRTVYFKSIAKDRAFNIEPEKDLGSTGVCGVSVDIGGAPTNLTYNISGGNVLFDWDAPAGNISGYSWAFNGLPDDSIDTTGTSLSTPEADLQDGYYTFYVKAFDSQGGTWSAAVSVTLLIDRWPPVIDGTIVYEDDYFIFSGTATDNVRITRLQYRLIGSYYGESGWIETAADDGAFDSTIEAFTATRTAMKDDNYTLELRAFDGLDQVSATITRTFEIMLSGPEVTVSIGSNSFSSNGSGIIDVSPQIIANLIDGNGLSIATIEVAGNSNTETQTFTLSGNEQTIEWLPPSELEEGSYTVRIRASDIHENTSEMTLNLQAYSGGVRIENEYYSYPNPFRPGETTTFKYFLTADADIKIAIYDSLGRPVKIIQIPRGDEGGHADWNYVAWDGKDNFGRRVPYGPYFYFIICEGKVIGRGEMAAYK